MVDVDVERVKERTTILKYHIQNSNYIHYKRALFVSVKKLLFSLIFFNSWQKQ